MSRGIAQDHSSIGVWSVPGRVEVDRVMYRCMFGGPADDAGVCVEHGETACVVGVTVEADAEADAALNAPHVRAEDLDVEVADRR